MSASPGKAGGGKPAGSPFFKPGLGPIPKPGQKSLKSPIAIPGMKQPAPATPQTVSSANYQTIREHAVSALMQAGKPLTFDGLFDKMVAGGCPMPADKPKVIVRKVLCNSPDVFSVTNKGLYTINESYVPEAPQAGPVEQAAMPGQPVQMPIPTQPVIPLPVAQPVAAPQPVIPAEAPAPQPVTPVGPPVSQPVTPAPQPVPAQQPAQTAAPDPKQKVPTASEPQPAPVKQPEPSPTLIAQKPQSASIPAHKTAAPAKQVVQTAKPVTAKVIPAAAPVHVAEIQKKHTVPPPSVVPRPPTVPPPRRTEKEQPASTPIDDLDASMASLDTTARRALTSSGQGSIRERATSAILTAGRPLSLEEVLDKLKCDGNPLPQHNAKDIVKTVLNNKSLFKAVDNGKYLPISD